MEIIEPNLNKEPFPFYSIKNIKEFLIQNKANALKKWGQNFLVDYNNIKIIIDSISSEIIEQTNYILEIGPGLGALTYHFSQLKKKNILFEIDPVYVEYLKLKFPYTKIIMGDVLEHLHPYYSEKVIIVGSLPYYISSEILRIVVQNFKYLQKGIFIVQKEFAFRITHEISSLAVLLKAYGNFRIIKHIPASCFYPKPKVDSTIIEFDPGPVFFSKESFIKLEQLCRIFFWGKRKNIQSILNKSPKLKNEDSNFREKIKDAMIKNGLELSKRPDELNYSNYHSIIQTISG